MPELPTMSLKAAQFNPVAFTPFQYEYKPTDLSILERSLAQREERMNKAAEAKGFIDGALAETELKLNKQDKDWFRNYKTEINNKIQAEIDAGNYGSAFRTATTTAGEVAKDSRLLSRIEANAKYQEDMKTLDDRVAKGEISQLTKEWWLNNKGAYNNRVSVDNDDIVTINDTPILYSDFDFSGIWASAAKLLPPEKGSTSNQSQVTNIDGTGFGSQSGRSYERLKKEDILNAVITYLETGDNQAKIKQYFDVQKYHAEKLKAEYDNTDDETRRSEITLELEKSGILGANNQIIDYDTYLKNNLENSPWGNLLAYEYVTTQSGSSTDNNSSRTNSGNGGIGQFITNNRNWITRNPTESYPTNRQMEGVEALQGGTENPG